MQFIGLVGQTRMSLSEAIMDFLAWFPFVQVMLYLSSATKMHQVLKTLAWIDWRVHVHSLNDNI